MSLIICFKYHFHAKYNIFIVFLFCGFKFYTYVCNVK